MVHHSLFNATASGLLCCFWRAAPPLWLSLLRAVLQSGRCRVALMRTGGPSSSSCVTFARWVVLPAAGATLAVPVDDRYPLGSEVCSPRPYQRFVGFSALHSSCSSFFCVASVSCSCFIVAFAFLLQADSCLVGLRLAPPDSFTTRFHARAPEFVWAVASCSAAWIDEKDVHKRSRLMCVPEGADIELRLARGNSNRAAHARVSQAIKCGKTLHTADQSRHMCDSSSNSRASLQQTAHQYTCAP